MMKAIVQGAVVVGLLAGLAGCEQAKEKLRRNTHYFEGVNFKTKVEKVKEDRQAFRVVVRNASQGLTGSKEAARVAAHRYCIENYGSTDITYTGQGPETENEALVLSNGQLVIDGRCAGW